MRYLIPLLFILSCVPEQKRNAEITTMYNGVVEVHHLPDFDSEERFRNQLSDDKSPDFIIFSSPYCGACIDLKNILNNLGWRDKVIVLNFHEKWVNFVAQTVGINAVPAMIIDKDRGKTISKVYVGSGEIGKVLYEHLEKKK